MVQVQVLEAVKTKDENSIRPINTIRETIYTMVADKTHSKPMDLVVVSSLMYTLRRMPLTTTTDRKMMITVMR